MKKYYFKIHPLLYIYLSTFSGIGIYTAIFEKFYFGYVTIAMFGIPLLLLLSIQKFKLDTLEIHQDKIVFGLFNRKTIRKVDIISIEVMGNIDINRFSVIIKYSVEGVPKEAELTKVYNVKLRTVYKELTEYLDAR
ncbi:MAG: hypothetical protein KKH01_01770 [Firmicutes bacterium]|nr:hypothetical protein [Bacillota bacterium]